MMEKKRRCFLWDTAAGKEGDTMRVLPLWSGLWQLLIPAVLIGVLVLIVLLCMALLKYIRRP